MKILWFNWRDIKNPQAGGAEVMTHETAKRMVKAGDEVIIFASKFPGAKTEEVIDGIKIIRKGNLLSCRFWAYLAYRREFKGKIDTVIDEINTIPFFTNLYVREKKIALIHQLAREYWWTQAFFPLNLFGFLLESFYLKQYRNITTIAASVSTKKDLEKLGFRNVYVFHQGLSVTPLARLPQKPKVSEILFIGRLTKPKGPQDAIMAFKAINGAIPMTKLIIVGKGKPKFIDSLKTLVERLGLKNSVSFAGFVTESEKVNLLKRAKIILVPSVREGWNLVPIEANSEGCTPIGYDVPGLCDSIINDQTGILTKKNDPQNLASAAISILSNKKLYQKLATGGLSWAKKFSWGKTYISFAQILEKIPKKILWLSWRDIKNPDAGGAEKVAIETTTRFARDGVDVTIFTSSFKGAKKYENIKGVKIIRRGNLLTCRLLAFFYYLRNKEFDLIIDEINTIPFFSVLYAKSKSVPLIHQLAREYWFTQTIWPLGLLGFWLEPRALKLYRKQKTIVVSESTEKDLEYLGFKNVKIVREGLDIKPEFPKKKRDLILFIGRLTRAKGPSTAIMAFDQIAKAVPRTKLFIVGKGEPKFTNYLIKLSKKLNLEKRVNFRGFVSQTSKIDLLKKAKIVLIPSIREGWNLVTTEANALGCVPIGYNVPGLRDSIKNGKSGLLVNTDPQSLAKGAISILKNEQLRIKMARFGYKWSQHFSWENCYQDFKSSV